MHVLTRVACIAQLVGVAGFGLRPRSWHAPRSRTTLSAVTELGSLEDFERAIEDAGDSLVVVDFSTSGCTPCQIMAPKYAHLSTLYDDTLFYCVVGDKSDDAARLMQSQDVSMVPTFQFFKSGVRRNVLSGAKLNSMDLIDVIETIRWEM